MHLTQIKIPTDDFYTNGRNVVGLLIKQSVVVKQDQTAAQMTLHKLRNMIGMAAGRITA